MSAPEWDFDELPEDVDLDRLWEELHSLVAIMAYCYLGELKSKAPLTYARLREYALGKGDTVFEWGKG